MDGCIFTERKTSFWVGGNIASKFVHPSALMVPSQMSQCLALVIRVGYRMHDFLKHQINYLFATKRWFKLNQLMLGNT